MIETNLIYCNTEIFDKVTKIMLKAYNKRTIDFIKKIGV